VPPEFAGHETAEQDTVLKKPLLWQVDVPEPE